MKQAIAATALSLFTFFASFSLLRGQELAPAVTLDYAGLGRGLVEALVRGDFAGAEMNFDETMKDALPPEKLADVWKILKAQVGKYQRVNGVRIERSFPYHIVNITCEFTQMPIDVQVTYTQNGKIAGLFFVPTKVTAEYRLPDYAKPDKFSDKETIVGSSKWALPATLSLPTGEGPFPAVVLVQGSGPQDRDESYGPNKPFRDLALGLAARGIAVLRYEKRTKQYGLKCAAIKDRFTVKEETVDDALSAVALLRGRPEIDRGKIFVLGHSLGGMLIPRIGLSDQGIAGFIVLAGNTRPLEDLILDQVNYLFGLDGKISAEEKTLREEIMAQVAKVKEPGLSAATPSDQLPLGVPAAYWLDLRGYQPAEAAKNLSSPLLILQGARDYQVTSADFEGWERSLSSRSNVEFKMYPKLNHFFIENEGKITPAEYEQAGHIAKYVIDDIADWIIKH
jgi:fermentation-respiration switch protein FrsA (DUF1100 family)